MEKKDTGEEMVNGMKFYELTELSHTILNGILATYSRLWVKEMHKQDQNPMLFQKLEQDSSTVAKLLHDSETFSTLARMEEVINHYGPLLKKLYEYEKNNN